MIITRIKIGGNKVRLAGLGFQKYQMAALGQFAVTTIKERVARGIGSDDAPMKPLSGWRPTRRKNGVTLWEGGWRGYKGQKVKEGGKPFRDLTLTGKMLRDFTLRYADANQARMDITTRDGRIKARANERRSPWFGFSRADERKIYAKASEYFKGSVANFGIRLRGGTGQARKPIWMDPLGFQTRRGVA
jgi:hypothetical protein